ncbi:hypothetical protein Gotri_003719, partial [Gossypium trilobum]|nr:hypothetical protein [Gossypium trilobum]
MVTELWMILHGLEIAQRRGYTKVIVASNCIMVVDMTKKCSRITHSMALVRKIKEVSGQVSTVKFQFVNRERNKVADWLTKSCHSNDINLVYVDVPTPHVRRLLLKDIL